MTHLLATLLTGGRFTAMKTSPSPEGPGDVAGQSFDRMMRERTETVQDNRHPEPGPEGRGDERAAGDHDGSTNGRAGESGVTSGTSSQEALASRVTLLGVRLGGGVRVPSLTFMLPEGGGVEDLAAAVRTQVLRQVANRQLDPGSLDNLRLAISSRELGQVDVDLKASGERLEVKIVTAGREAESVLRRTSGDLKEALLTRTDRFREVDVKVENRTAAEDEDHGRHGREDGEPSRGNGRGNGQGFNHDGDPDEGPAKEG